jgi:hypothetical protein
MPVLVTVAQPYVRAMLAGRPVRLVTALAQELAFWAFWIVVTPLIAWLVRRVRPAPGQWGRALPLHLGAAVVRLGGGAALLRRAAAPGRHARPARVRHARRQHPLHPARPLARHRHAPLRVVAGAWWRWT